jgi:hypothetical protein
MRLCCFFDGFDEKRSRVIRFSQQSGAMAPI